MSVWRDGSVVKSADHFSRRPRIDLLHPYGASQLYIIPVPVDLELSSMLQRKCTLMAYMQASDAYI